MTVFGMRVAEATVLKSAEGLGVVAGGGMLAQIVPGLPENFQSWPVTAMSFLFGLAALGLAFMVLKLSFAANEKKTKAICEMAVAQAQTNSGLQRVADEMSESNRQSDEMNRKISKIVQVLWRKPCLKDEPKEVLDE